MTIGSGIDEEAVVCHAFDFRLGSARSDSSPSSSVISDSKAETLGSSSVNMEDVDDIVLIELALFAFAA
jgi:hypothetical protein